MIYQIEAQGTRNTNISSISPGVTGGGRKLAGKWLSKGNLQISTKPCTILRKGAHFRTQELKTLGKTLTHRRKTRRKPAEGEEEDRSVKGLIRRLPAPARGVEARDLLAGDGRSRRRGASAPATGGGGTAATSSQLPLVV